MRLMPKIEFHVVGSVVEPPCGARRHEALAAAVADVIESDCDKTLCVLFNYQVYLIRFVGGELTVQTLRGDK